MTETLRNEQDLIGTSTLERLEIMMMGASALDAPDIIAKIMAELCTRMTKGELQVTDTKHCLEMVTAGATWLEGRLNGQQHGVMSELLDNIRSRAETGE